LVRILHLTLTRRILMAQNIGWWRQSAFNRGLRKFKD
jgi:hypothetical protein